MKRIGRSVLAVFTGLITVIVLSVGVDALLHATKVFPPPDQPMYSTSLLMLALSYRAVFSAVGGYVTARLAPSAVLMHVVALAGIGLVLGLLGIVAATRMNLGPIWYPIAVAASGPVFTLIGGWWWLLRAARSPAPR